MRKILIFAYCLILIHLNINAQTEESTYNVTFSNKIPPSPDAFSFTKYGDVNINEYIGLFNYNIPLVDFKSSNLSLPIFMSYTGAGVKVLESPTKTGIGWVLNAGGVITRTINDIADEEAGTGSRIFLTDQQFFNLNTEDGSPGAIQLNSYASNYNNVDTEIDIFQFSFNGYNGSFYLDQNLQPLLIKEDAEIKIEIIGNLLNDKKFLITTPDGVKYYFGGDNTEKTFTLRQADKSGNTSFYLYKIEHPLNGIIYLEYDKSPLKSINFDISETLTVLKNHDYPTPFYVSEQNENATNGWVHCDPPFKHPNYKISNNLQKINNFCTIKKIRSDKNSLNLTFNYSTYNGFKVLDNIRYNDTLSLTILNEIKFNYENLDKFIADVNHDRFFLKSITFNNQSSLNNKKEFWEFKYEDIEHMVKRNSKAQDMAGFYNGKNDNTTLLSSYDFYLDYASANSIFHYDGANRSSNIQFAKKGALTKIIYPNKGFTEIDYECVPYKRPVKKEYKLYIQSGQDPNLEEGEVTELINYSLQSYPVINESSEEITFTNYFPSSIENQIVNIKIKSGKSELHGGNKSYNLKITNLTTASVVYDVIKAYGWNVETNFDFTFLKDNSYKVELTGINSISSGMFYACLVSFEYITSYEYGDGPGLRVKKVVDHTNNSVNYKRFYYLPLNILSKPIHLQPIPIGFNEFKNTFSLLYYNGCSQEPFVPFFSLYETITSNSISSIFEEERSYNNYVTISFGGDNFEKGGVEKIFSFEEDSTSYQQELQQMTYVNLLNQGFSNEIVRNDFLNNRSNNIQLNGELIKESYFKKKGDNFYIVKEANYKYSNLKIDNYVNLVGKKFYEPFFYPEQDMYGKTTSNYYLKIYKTFRFKNNLIEKKEAIYFDNVLFPDTDFLNIVDYLSLFNDSSVNKIKHIETYTYGSLKGLPIEITTSTSDSSIINRTVNKYVNDANSINDLPLGQASLAQSLLNENRVVEPLQTQSYENNNLLFTKRTLYKILETNNVSKILPEKIQIAKGTQILEDKAIFYNYDEQFNPVIVGYSGSPKTRYMYNTEGLVVAKIENYTGSTSNFSLVIGNLDNTSCTLQNQYPDALVTVYQYNLITKKVVKVTDPNCRNTYYEYDDLQHLKWIKDHDGNIVKEFDQQFKPQN